MNRWEGKVALVTGASAGIGLAIAENLTENGLKVVGLARRKERLEELAKKLSSKKGKFYSFQADISKEEDIIEAFKWTKKNVGPVSILINNAGVMYTSKISDCNTQDYHNILNVNVLGLCIACKEAIKQMKENNIDGHIININSVLGHKVSVATLNIYAASKYAVTAITESLRLELANEKSKIKITSLSPGFVKTEITVGKLSEEVFGENERQAYFKSSDIADAVAYVLSTPKNVQISELTIQPMGEIFKITSLYKIQ